MHDHENSHDHPDFIRLEKIMENINDRLPEPGSPGAEDAFEAWVESLIDGPSLAHQSMIQARSIMDATLDTTSEDGISVGVFNGMELMSMLASAYFGGVAAGIAFEKAGGRAVLIDQV